VAEKRCIAKLKIMRAASGDPWVVSRLGGLDATCCKGYASLLHRTIVRCERIKWLSGIDQHPGMHEGADGRINIVGSSKTGCISRHMNKSHTTDGACR
jgi:hypothetical protein